MDRIRQLEALVLTDPGDPAFAELADIYRRRGDYGGALDLCFNGLSTKPDCLSGRAVLARIFYERRQFPFAVRELEALAVSVPHNGFVARLLAQLNGSHYSPEFNHGQSSEGLCQFPTGTVSEAVFSPEDFEAIDLFGKDS